MAHPQAKHIVTVVFVGTALFLSIFLLATINSHSPRVPWSTAHLSIPGVKGFSKFGLMSLDVCVEDRCRTEDYNWLSRYTRMWKSDTGSCQQASKTIVGLLTVGVITSLLSTVMAISQLSDHAYSKTPMAVNITGMSLLIGTIMFVSASGVWVAQCHERLEETATVTLAWGWAMAVLASGLTFIALLLELLIPAPWGEANIAGGTFTAHAAPLISSSATVEPVPGQSYGQLSHQAV